MTLTSARQRSKTRVLLFTYMRTFLIGSPTSQPSTNPCQNTLAKLQDIHWLNFGWGDDTNHDADNSDHCHDHDDNKCCLIKSEEGFNDDTIVVHVFIDMTHLYQPLVTVGSSNLLTIPISGQLFTLWISFGRMSWERCIGTKYARGCVVVVGLHHGVPLLGKG